MAYCGPFTPESPSPATCTFRRSRLSKVFYESPSTARTSWEFCTVPEQDYGIYYGGVHDPNMNANLNLNANLSVLRSGAQSPSAPSPYNSPMQMILADSSHRSIPSPPNMPIAKDDLSDGSRNSTGSAGSHRSQDSGFSDSGEAGKRREKNSVTYLIRHDRSHSTPVPPSPIPHHTSATFTLTPQVQGQSQDLNGNSACSNCLYQEVLYQTAQQQTPIYSALSPGSRELGVPICTSTPKRSNLSMPKIDNFESLNKNVNINRSPIDKNNNSPGILSNASGISLGKKANKGSGKERSKLKDISNSCSGTDHSRSSSNIIKSRILGTREPLPLPHEATYASNSTNSTSQYQRSQRQTTLPKGYKRVSAKDLTTTLSGSREGDGAIVVKSHYDNDAMRLWLHELRSQTEMECLSVLLTKTIPEPVVSKKGAQKKGKKAGSVSGSGSDTDSGLGSEESRKTGREAVQAIHSMALPLRSIRTVEEMANIVSAEFSKICKNIEFGFLHEVPSLVLNLVSYVEKFLVSCQASHQFPNLHKLESRLCRSCRKLEKAAVRMLELGGGNGPRNVYSILEEKGEAYPATVNEAVNGIVSVGNLFSQVVDLRLTRDLSSILDTIERGGVPAKLGLKSLVNILLDGGNHLCRLASEIRTVRGLLGVSLDAGDDHLRILALRCLATVLCVGEAVKDFDRASGFEIVADFMYEPRNSFELKIEAVSVLTQATDPWIDLETSLSTLGPSLDKIVIALTNLVPECVSSEEAFLLVVAAISNLTFLEVSSIDLLRRYNTMAYVINLVGNRGTDYSVFVLDHVATILANMAGVERCRDSLVKVGAVHALLSFLQSRPRPSTDSAAEIMACERVQQKSTIAISRLCAEEGVAKLIVDRGGMGRFIQLCRNEKERNYSDGVLIAALATLRKLVGICGDEIIRGLEADDLIQPRLLDSFLLFSSRQESYV